jgi:hypothetical protein
MLGFALSNDNQSSKPEKDIKQKLEWSRLGPHPNEVRVRRHARWLIVEIHIWTYS